MSAGEEPTGTVSGYDFGIYADASETAARAEERDGGDVAARVQEKFGELKRSIHTKLLQRIRPEELSQVSEEERRGAISRAVEHMVELEHAPLNAAERIQLVQDLLNDILGLGPLEALLCDPTVSDILVNGGAQVYVGRGGALEGTARGARGGRGDLWVWVGGGGGGGRVVAPGGRAAAGRIAGERRHSAAGDTGF